MDSSQAKAIRTRKKRVLRSRKKLRNSERPRLCIMKSNKHLYVQLIDDEKAITLASMSTLSKDFSSASHNRKNQISAKQLGLKIAELAKQQSVSRVVCDRSGFKYHGLVAALADGAREGGLEF
ncbi:MAG: 50S ribosomal protein L18 [Chlamydiales bacterium]